MYKAFNFDIFINSIRCLFPRWNFFQSTQYQFKLEIKNINEKHWTKIQFLQKRKMYNLLFNPNCNLDLAQVNVIEHFAEVIQLDSKNNKNLQIKKITSLRLIQSLVISLLQDMNLKQGCYQFKVVAENLNEKIEIYKSDEIPFK